MASDKKINRLAMVAAEFFYCGRSPFMPGTVGSLGSLFIWIPSVFYNWGMALQIALLVAIFAVGVWASGHAIAYYQKSDPQQVVIDEVVGQGLPFLIVGPSMWQCLLAFVLFRGFDIVKPWPIKYLERRFPDRFGIMIDDVAAGIYAIAVLAIIKYFWPAL